MSQGMTGDPSTTYIGGVLADIKLRFSQQLSELHWVDGRPANSPNISHGRYTIYMHLMVPH